MKHRISVFAVLFAFALSTLTFAQAAPDSVKKAEPAKSAVIEKSARVEKPGWGNATKSGMKEETLVQRIHSASSLKTFAELIKAADLEKTLEGTGEFTVFAPNDEAFKKIPAETLNALKQDKAKLTEVLKNHIIAGKRIGRLDLAKMKGQKIKAASGMELTVADVKGKWMVGGAGLTGLNLLTVNGPIHEIDAVIMPGAVAAPTAVKTSATETTPSQKAPVKEEQKEEKK